MDVVVNVKLWWLGDTTVWYRFSTKYYTTM